MGEWSLSHWTTRKVPIYLIEVFCLPDGIAVKKLPANAGDARLFRVQSLSGQDPLELEMATYSSILPRKFHGQRNLAGYSPAGPKESDTTEHMNMRAHICFTVWR